MIPPDETRADSALERFRALLEVSEAIAAHRGLPGLFHDLAQRLPRVVSFDFLVLVLYEAERNVMRLHILESRLPTTIPAGTELPVEESVGGVVWQTQSPLVISNAEEDERFPRIMPLLRAHDVKSLCMLPLTTALRRLGAMGFGSTRAEAFGQSDVEFLIRVARQVAVAVDNALNYQDAQSYEQQLGRDRDRLRLLLEINNTLVANLDLRELFAAISTSLRRVMHHDYTSLTLLEAEASQLRLHALDFPLGKGLVQEEMVTPLEGSVPARAIQSGQAVLLNKAAECDQARQSELARRHLEEGLQSVCFIPLINRDRVLGTLNVGSLREGAFTAADVELLVQVSNQIAIAVGNALAFGQIAELKAKLAEEKLYLEDEIRTEHDFEEIVGESEPLRRVLKKVETVAPTDSTILIQGETGTGKEVIARAVHQLSPRRDATFVKINCAAIPSGLLESELFGHEKGAFTGAIAQRIGRFELAHGGTLFLDEIGDIPLELQPKLLRVLQEKEFERLGSARTQRVDVRLIAATNQDLAQRVAEREFRSDLYYRVNVFPIVVPPLRDRRGDIPLLVRYFTQKHARRMNKRIETIPSEIMEALQQWHWPGNIRELENIVERAVILSPGPTLRVPLAALTAAAESAPPAVATLEAAEREHILRALRETNGVVGGPRGAASLLGMKRTTLQSRMAKLGISDWTKPAGLRVGPLDRESPAGPPSSREPA
ncbi:MAG TPA: sigma 54-interacting transcriptional regulator [Thermoanaerobaculia bacterium]|nr:sigma 54-interacting transcriptional regulator [Thermoanaerobaculia bacterium]